MGKLFHSRLNQGDNAGMLKSPECLICGSVITLACKRIASAEGNYYTHELVHGSTAGCQDCKLILDAIWSCHKAEPVQILIKITVVENDVKDRELSLRLKCFFDGDISSHINIFQAQGMCVPSPRDAAGSHGAAPSLLEQFDAY